MYYFIVLFLSLNIIYIGEFLGIDIADTYVNGTNY